MKQEEKIAEKYLKSLSIGEVVYEPDGNVPPDFSVGESIGVEVRRLNENTFNKDGAQGLENKGIPLEKSLKNILASFDNQYQGKSYFIVLRYRRPVGKQVFPQIRSALSSFLDSNTILPSRLKITANLELHLYESHPNPGKLFLHYMTIDLDSGGMIEDLYIKNIEHCIMEKKQKIQKYEERYKEWWLVLVDTIGWGYDDFEKNAVISSLLNYDPFVKIIVIDWQSNFILEIS